ncbi:MAG: DUF4476 domain-containing protein [Chitinophagaceae bacterium]|nr:MAG: DUF4476 domain-containing protein [Chitinophagaceae bacterium]
MRTTFTLFLALLVSTSFARPFYPYYDEGRLTITFAGLTNLVVQVDNRYYAPTDNVISLEHVPAGRHTVRVYQPRNNNRGNVLYTAQVQIKSYIHTDLMFNRFGRAYIDERRVNGIVNNDYSQWGNGNYGDSQGWTDADWNNGNWGNGGGYSGGWGNGGNNNGNGNGGGGNNNGGGYGNGGYNNGSYGAMNANSFTALLQQLRNENFDNTKMTIARDALSSNRVSVAQVKQLMQQFTFDSDRLELAKAAYPRCTDKNNYFQLSDAFEFSSSKESLSTWVRNQH